MTHSKSLILPLTFFLFFTQVAAAAIQKTTINNPETGDSISFEFPSKLINVGEKQETAVGVFLQKIDGDICEAEINGEKVRCYIPGQVKDKLLGKLYKGAYFYLLKNARETEKTGWDIIAIGRTLKRIKPTNTITLHPPGIEELVEDEFPEVTLASGTTGEEEEEDTTTTTESPTITTLSSLPDGSEGTAYSTTLSASGGVSPYTWSLVSGSLPSGLSLSSSGVISGTIAASGQQGTHTFTVKVTDSVGSTATKQFTITVGYAAPTFSVTQITNNSYNDTSPQICDGKVTWYGSDGSDDEIYYWDGTTITQITNNSHDDYSPQIYDGKITWYGSDGSDNEIYYWDGTTTTQITNNSRFDSSPQIYDGKITWYGSDGSDNEIYYWDGTTTTQITNNSTSDTSPQIYNGKIAWHGSDGSDNEIFYWDGTTTTQITNNSTSDTSPQIYNGKITWYGSAGSDSKVYYWDGSTTTQITNSTSDYSPQIYNGKITWYGSDGSDNEIYYWDGTTTTQITNNSTNDADPRIYDGKITWYGSDGSDNEIFFAERTAGSDPNITGHIYDSSSGETISAPVTSIYQQNSTTALTSTTNNPYSFNVADGNYYIRVEKEGYTFPSNTKNGQTAGDHGEVFTASGSSMTIDIPIDSGYPLEITKTANKRRVVNGDIITYDIKIRNNSMWSFSNINIIDEITNGFKYVKDKTYIDNTQLSEKNVSISNRQATFKLSNVPGHEVTHLTYQVRVGSGISPGEYRTVAVAWDRVRDWQMSNESSNKIEVVHDALFTMGTIIGKVFNDENKNGVQDPSTSLRAGEAGIAGVRIATEYGVIVETDKDGKYHIPAVPPGNHLLKIDPSSLPSTINHQPSASFTTENPYLVKITEGLLAKVNFGVIDQANPQTRKPANQFFIVALGEGVVRNLDTNGNIDMVGQDDRYDSGVNVDGKLGLYLKGKIKGKYLVTLSIDTNRHTSKQANRQTLFTNLDPDKYYPVYGDASKIDYTAVDTQDELYLLIEWDESFIKYGAFNTEIPLYNRTLQGLNIVYESTKKTKFGDPYTKINTFYARAYQVAAHDEFIGTGGSLYYLRHTPVIEGSEKVKVELRDPVSKEAQATAILTEERDYEIDYDTGRVLLKKPLSSINYNYNGSIISNDILNGSRAYLIVDYEYESTSTIRKEAYGIKASQQLGNYIRVGGTYIEEEKEAQYYKLMGGDSTIKINENTEITGEYNRTEETQLSGAYSIDGGLSYSTLTNTVNDNKTGSGVSIKGKTRLFNNTDINLGYTRQDDSYSATDTIATQGSNIYTGSILTRLKENLLIGIKHITQEVQDALLSSDLTGNNKVHTTTALLDYIPNKLDIRLEYQHQEVDNSFIDFTYAGYRQLKEHDIIGGRIGYRITPKIHPYLGGQGTIQGQTNNQGYIGLEYQIWDNTNLNIKETVGNLGNSTLLGLTSQITEDTLAYTDIEIGNNSQIGERYTKTTYGQRTQVDKDSSLNWGRDYSSYQSSILQGELVGYDTKLSDTLSLGVNYERAQIEKEATAISRDSGSIVLSYLNIDKLKAFSKLELREDRSTLLTARQWLTQNSILYQLTEAISLILRANWSETRNRTTHSRDAEFYETGIGLAYRPVKYDKLNLLAKYSYITNDIPESQNEFSQTQEAIMNIYAMEGAYDVIKPIQLVGKFAVRDKSEKVGPRDWTDSMTYLYIGRLNIHITNKWDIATEYRTLANREIEDTKSGWLFEIDRELAKYVRFGVGYNFTDYDDDLSNDDNYDAKGWFVRVNGKY